MVMIIAIDGPASVGKSTIAEKISNYYNSPYLNSGKLYRAIAFQIKIKNINLSNKQKILKCARAIKEIDLKSRELYSSEIDKIASKISAKKYLRNQLMKFQKEYPKKYAKSNKYAIIEGRDIGTEIFPGAHFKFFLWADAMIRAKRRCNQILKKGGKVSLNYVYKEIVARDLRDLNRKTAPLKPAVNSVLLDTSYLDIEQVFNAINKIIKKDNI